MMKIIKVKNRGMLEIQNSKVTCYLRNDNNFKKSEDLKDQLKDEKNTMSQNLSLGEEKYLIIYPIPKKDISIITSNGKKFRSTIYFLDDIKNIIDGFNIENPCFCENGVFIKFSSDNDYKRFLFNKTFNTIKDICKEVNDFTNLETNFNKYLEEFQTRKSMKLKEINRNINLYSKIDKIGEENYFLSIPRNSLYFDINAFIEKKKEMKLLM